MTEGGPKAGVVLRYNTLQGHDTALGRGAGCAAGRAGRAGRRWGVQ